MNNKVRLFCYLLFKWLPVKKKTVLFSSFHGLYNDNPKAISVVLKEMMPDIEIYWEDSGHEMNDFPSYVTTLPKNSLRFLWFCIRAQVVVDNYSGKFLMHLSSSSKLIRRVFTHKNQLSISTWHGTPLKKIANDVPEKKDFFKALYTSSDMLLAGCEYTQKCLGTAIPGVPIELTGTPRNDVFFQNTIDRDNIKKKLGLPVDKKVLLYAPTFRDSVAMSGLSQMKDLNFRKILDSLKAKTGEDWVISFRAHHDVMRHFDLQAFNEKSNVEILDANKHIDMAEYLLCSDILLTDYSSSMFDFVLTKKPVFLYVPDKTNYSAVERGFYMNIEDLPFSISQTPDELYNAISAFEQNDYEIAISEMMLGMGYMEDGKASERIASKIKEFIG